MNDTHDYAIQKMEELIESIVLSEETVNSIIDGILPHGQEMEEETRVALTYTMSLFAACLGTAAFDEMTDKKTDELDRHHIESALSQMNLDLQTMKKTVDMLRERNSKETPEFINTESQSEPDSITLCDGQIPLGYHNCELSLNLCSQSQFTAANTENKENSQMTTKERTAKYF
ncbi:hypothetical protein M3Y98_00744000 [Aphelenchoides besseyi]|nr:hypothetical protein M3Y98_00744000 [Aphelenchoides besseyi]